MSQPDINVCLNTVASHPLVYREDFFNWLEKNWHVYLAFAEAADKVWNAGWKHYSARTILEVLRHRSNVREIDGSYKISNNMIPDCARLYMMQHPERHGLFTMKTTELRVAA